MADPAKPSIYPRYCFHLAPTVNAWCFMRVADVHNLDQHAGFEGENFFFYKNLPIKWVRVVGVVVAIDEFYGRRVYTVDDSSGACIECTITTPTDTKDDDVKKEDEGASHKTESANNRGPTSALDLQVGNIIDVKGGISIYRDEKQINIEKTATLRCTAQEVALWEKRTKFKAEILEKPWVLRDRDIRKCRREAEHSEEKAERKRRRLKVMMEGRSSKESVKPSHEDPKQKTDGSNGGGKEPAKSNKNSLNLRQILQHGGKGRYDALGL